MNINQLRDNFNKGKKLKYIFFWGHKATEGVITKSCLSQWYNCKFTVDNIIYHTAEQYMMAQKAILFGDDEVCKKIMAANNPGEYKKLGRQIRNFDQQKWDKHKYDIVVKGNTAKFSQNDNIKYFLLNTGDRILVEASPYDGIWGIAMSKNDPNIENPLMWKGENLLGFALMDTRENLKSLK